MAIVLTIVKIILILLAVVACILAAVLFLPVRYEVDLDIDGKQADVRVNWLLRLVRFWFHAGKPMKAVLSILFFKVDFTDPEAKRKRAEKRARKEKKKAAKAKRKNRKKRRGDKKRKEKKEPPEAVLKADSSRDFSEKEDGNPPPESPSGNVLLQEQISGVTGRDDAAGKTGDVFGKNAETESGISGQDGSVEGKMKTAAEKISDIAGKTDDTAKKIGDMAGKVSGAGKTAKRILGLLQKYDILEIVWPKLARFLNRILPRSLTGCVAFGLEDPATTGKLVGALAMVPFLYQTELRIVPDFETEETYVKGRIYARGHLCLVWVAILAIGLLKEKRLRQFVSDIRHGREP